MVKAQGIHLRWRVRIQKYERADVRVVTRAEDSDDIFEKIREKISHLASV
jgi:hypothetical protein